jgi:hypothetical protein
VFGSQRAGSTLRPDTFLFRADDPGGWLVACFAAPFARWRGRCFAEMDLITVVSGGAACRGVFSAKRRIARSIVR